MKFYVLDASVGSRAETSCEPVGARRLGAAPICPECGVYVGMMPWEAPYVVRLVVHGTKIGDIAFYGGGDLFVSDRFVAAWRRERLAGMDDLTPIEIVGDGVRMAGREDAAFFHTAVPRTSARLDRGRSIIVRESGSSCDLCGGDGIVTEIRGLWIDEDSWRGEDIFRPWGICGVIVVSERVPAVAARYGLENVLVRRVEQFVWSG